MKKIVSAIIICSFMLLLLSGCAEKDTVIYSLGEHTVTRSQYMYWASYYKTSFRNVFIEAGYIDPDEYNEDFWSTSSPEGGTLKDMTVQSIDDSVKKMLVCLELFDELGFGSDQAALDEIKTAVEEKINEDIAGIGSRSALNKELGAYGLNINSLKELYNIEFRRAYVIEYLYGDNGKEKVTDEERDAYYEENYHREKHVLIDLNEKYVLNDKGERVMDPTTGYYKTEKLTETEKNERKKLAEQVFEKAENGEDFDKLIEEYGEDDGMAYYTDGYFMKESDSFEENFLEAVLDMKPDEIRMVESTYGMYIIKKYPLEERGYKKEENVNFFTGLDDLVQENKENERLTSRFDKISTDGTAYASVDFSAVPIMSDVLSGLDD